MSNSAKTIFYFGIYLAGLGTVLVFIPNPLLGLFGMPPTNEVWIRVLGMVVLFLAFYYVQAARAELTDFFRWTTYARSLVMLFLLAFVLFKLSSPMLLLFGGLDLLGAIWTAVALRQK